MLEENNKTSLLVSEIVNMYNSDNISLKLEEFLKDYINSNNKKLVNKIYADSDDFNLLNNHIITTIVRNYQIHNLKYINYHLPCMTYFFTGNYKKQLYYNVYKKSYKKKTNYMFFRLGQKPNFQVNTTTSIALDIFPNLDIPNDIHNYKLKVNYLNKDNIILDTFQVTKDEKIVTFLIKITMTNIIEILMKDEENEYIDLMGCLFVKNKIVQDILNKNVKYFGIYKIEFIEYVLPDITPRFLLNKADFLNLHKNLNKLNETKSIDIFENIQSNPKKNKKSKSKSKSKSKLTENKLKKIDLPETTNETTSDIISETSSSDDTISTTDTTNTTNTNDTNDTNDNDILKNKFSNYKISFNKFYTFENNEIIIKSLQDYYLKNINFQNLMDKYSQIWVIKDCHYSTFIQNQKHFNIKLFNEYTNELSLMLHANIDTNFNIINLTQITTI